MILFCDGIETHRLQYKFQPFEPDKWVHKLEQVGRSPSALLCPGANDALKAALPTLFLDCCDKGRMVKGVQVGTSTMDNPLLKYSAKEYFFKAALCHFIVDELNAKKLLEAHEEQNCDAYTEAVKEFDSISRLDQWLTTMLLRIKKSIQGDGDGDLK
ncbi:hypothetical protein AB205_0189650 [Aquarana catesbeiana]|uniref:Uncharacterized protein n=1 Tax=Aquarana catesbeiana TaxID=8400 RepID=A0A2G9RKT8_AQUCT|nr:hypothetical protein AB205_0189650 [Aquarana catesbeiana]